MGGGEGASSFHSSKAKLPEDGAEADDEVCRTRAQQGLVFTAGNADTFSRVLTTLKLLNSTYLASPMPAEIFSFPGEEPDEETRAELERLGARLRVVREAWRGEGRR